DFEGGSLLDLAVRLQVDLEQLDGFWQIALRTNQNFRRIYEGVRAIQRRGAHVGKRLLHHVELLPVPVEETQIQPRAGAAVTHLDGASVFTFGGRKVFLFFGNTSVDPMCARRIQTDE